MPVFVVDFVRRISLNRNIHDDTGSTMVNTLWFQVIATLMPTWKTSSDSYMIVVLWLKIGGGGG